MTTMTEKQVCKEIKAHLIMSDCVSGIENKKIIIKEMYKVIIANKDSLLANEKFAKTCKDKMIEFAFVNNFRLEAEYQILFNEQLPMKQETLKRASHYNLRSCKKQRVN